MSPRHDDQVTERRPPYAARGVGFVVRVVEGPDVGRTLRIDAGRPARWLIGKSPACDLVLTDPQASRRHAAFEIAGLRLGLVDLGSTNGTFVNDVAVASVFLSSGELIRIGSSALSVEMQASVEAPEEDAPSFGRMVGSTPRMRVVYTLAARLAAVDVPIVVEGETGAGKELLSECIHEASPRAANPFVVFDCSATINTATASATLFGEASRGSAGLFELAHGGSLFIDEVADLDVESQGALLRAIDRGEVRRIGDPTVRRVNVRTIVATRRDLDKLVEEGRFRDDLFFRLAVARIELPPLRRRTEDVAPLARHFWRRATGSGDLPDAFLDRYSGYDWPGNVRELANAVARFAALGPTASLLPSRHGTQARPGAGELSTDFLEEVLAADLPFPQARQRVLDGFERAYVERVLAKFGGNVAQAAGASGIARRYFQLIRARQAR